MPVDRTTVWRARRRHAEVALRATYALLALDGKHFRAGGERLHRFRRLPFRFTRASPTSWLRLYGPFKPLVPVRLLVFGPSPPCATASPWTTERNLPEGGILCEEDRGVPFGFGSCVLKITGWPRLGYLLQSIRRAESLGANRSKIHIASCLGRIPKRKPTKK